ncbi:hypothetical protein [Geobacter argillaceus]|uniref:Outer membrane beta-barrel porin/alpha-amylase n=1 Tax=Geobacter argillaceus TaxID=345631 RepID=A0A562W8H4_9BACT|nr:hypothetical protein [Geobacter argillaceus]TWJ26502.1 hypothetical protein JN12_01210 [Geobacter argillaceus]
MKKLIATTALAVTTTLAAAGAALATPSTQIWIPSTDIQPYKQFHLNIDNYFRASGVAKSAPTTTATRDANVMDIGPTVGILPFEKVQAEIGFDYLVIANDPNDNHPFSFNAKLGTPEDSICKFSPALAVGIYNAGPTQDSGTAPGVISGQNIVYALAAKTLPAIGPVPSLGRISAGYYRGAKRALINTSGKADNDGLLLSWDRTMSEISDKLWLAVDYMSGHNVDSATNVGFSWNFAKNVSVIFAYDIYKEKTLAGNNTFTTQLDINFP